MGCGSSKAVTTEETNSTVLPPAEPKNTVPPPVAFEVPLEEESIIKRHPPKRLQRLEELQQKVLTVDEIEEKQKKALERREEVLQERIRSSQKMQKMLERPTANLQNGIEKIEEEVTGEQQT
ncbi:uncharacterized protein LOC143227262 [Tachypleus tridentatus]|uniref:uncharacterized protein LOC143227262 n=1 Tax=Tachypleus tridentatus TaxID=6853 RepID=UPI003FD43608